MWQVSLIQMSESKFTSPFVGSAVSISCTSTKVDIHEASFITNTTVFFRHSYLKQRRDINQKEHPDAPLFVFFQLLL